MFATQSSVRGSGPPPVALEASAMFAVGALWMLVIAALIVLPGVLLKKGLHVGSGRLLTCGVVLCIGWPLLFALVAVGLPFVVFYAQLAWHALR